MLDPSPMAASARSRSAVATAIMAYSRTGLECAGSGCLHAVTLDDEAAHAAAFFAPAVQVQ
jgi:hypothetical protein